MEHQLFQRTMTELDRTRSWMFLLRCKTAKERLAFFLLEISERLEAPDASLAMMPLDSFELPMVRRQIADVPGSTIETFSPDLTKLKGLGRSPLCRGEKVAISDRDDTRRRAG